jgi:hypothetical protein
MPRVAPVLASDSDLAILYRWLDGVEATHTPPSIIFTLRSTGAGPADGQPESETVIEVAARTADPDPVANRPAQASLRYRVTLTQARAPVTNRIIEHQRDAGEGWSSITTDEHGEAMLDPDRGFLLAGLGSQPPATARLRIALAAGRYALLIEAIDDANPSSPIVAGIGTAIVNVE